MRVSLQLNTRSPSVFMTEALSFRGKSYITEGYAYINLFIFDGYISLISKGHK